MIYIYTLSDPRANNEIRYVGKSVDPTKRLKTHLAKARAGCETHCRRWIAGLLRSEVRPILSVIDFAETAPEANAAEQRHIAQLRAAGHDLTNLTVGGDGRAAGSPLRAETRARMSAARKGRPPARSVIEAAAEARRGKPRPRSAMEAAWAANRGRKWTAEERAAQSARQKGKPARSGWKHSDETRKKIGASSRERRSAEIALAARWGKCSPRA